MKRLTPVVGTARSRVIHDATARAVRPVSTLWPLVATLVILSGALAFVPSMHAWSLNLLRFVPRTDGILLWAIAALALIPKVARLLSPAFTVAGNAVERHSWSVYVVACSIVAVTLWLIPDRVWFTGDFIIRNPGVASNHDFALAFPENLPLDNWLHATLPRLIPSRLHISTEVFGHLLGAIEGACLAALAIEFVRAAGARGIAAATGWVILLAGGYLTMFTGFAKTAGELCLVTLAIGIGALRIARGERGLAIVLLATALGIALHRIMIVMLPVAIALALLGWRQEWSATAVSRRVLVAASVIFAGAVAITIPRIASIIGHYDVTHHMGSPGPGGPLNIFSGPSAAFRLLDLANALIVLSPLALAIPILVGASRGALLRRLETRWVVVLAVWLLMVALLMRPQQAMVRDWDVIAWAGVGLSMAVSLLVMQALNEKPREAWIGVSAAVTAIVLTGVWIVHDSNIDQGLARARALIDEPPHRVDAEVGNFWLYLGDRTAELGRWHESAYEVGRAAGLEPSPSTLIRWGIASSMAGDLWSARVAWRTLTMRIPADPTGWSRLALTDLDLDDCAEAQDAAATLVRLEPGDSAAARLFRQTTGCAGLTGNR